MSAVLPPRSICNCISAPRPCADSTVTAWPEQRLAFRSKNRLARAILETFRPLLPNDWTIYVQFDSWYASERLLKYIHRQGWHAVCALKSNRKLQGQRLRQFATTLQHKRYTRVRVTAADGHVTTYFARDAAGRLSRLPIDVRVIFSKRHPRARSWAYFLSNGRNPRPPSPHSLSCIGSSAGRHRAEAEPMHGDDQERRDHDGERHRVDVVDLRAPLGLGRSSR